MRCCCQRFEQSNCNKNSDYSAIEAYLVYQHDEFSGKVILDKQGRPMLRESYILDTLECGNFSFATACLLANRKYGKNTQRDDIKSHQYIISFDPRDAADNGLTMEKAQALGLKFCKENFPGHPAIVCTHPDGHNHSGNIHVHIVIGSIRTREVERKPYMQKPRDWLEGMKHSSTAQTMRHLRVEVMELCEGAGLYQIDLLNGSKERVSEAKYWARRRGQQKFDRKNAALTAVGQPPKQKKFETVKVACRGEAPPFAAQTARSLKSPTGAFVASQTRTLRKQISSVLYRATSFEDFSNRLMQQHGIAVKESRGQLSYLPSGRTKFIRAKHLGDKFEKGLVLATLQENAERKRAVQPKPDRIGKLVDIQAKLKQGKGIGYERWAKKHNLKAISQTLILLQEKGLLNEDALDRRIEELQSQYDHAKEVVLDLDARMKSTRKLLEQVAAYNNTKNIAQQLKTAKRPAVFEEQHRAELTAYRAAAAYFKANDITKLPSPKKLEAEYALLASEKAKFYEQYKEAKEELLKLKTAKQNVASFFREEEPAQQER
ncbi:relaxase [Faecalibacterium sp. AM43-5AT]|nr:relaxase [Faecalibacterium sp. AM43-5AT]